MKGKEELYQCPKCVDIFEPIIGINSQEYQKNSYRRSSGHLVQYSDKEDRYQIYCYKCYLDKIEEDLTWYIENNYLWNTLHKYITFQEYEVTLTDAKGTLFFEEDAKVRVFLRLEAKDKISISVPIDLSDLESVKNGIIDAITLMPKERKDKRAIKERSDQLKREHKHNMNYHILKVGFYTGLAEVCGLWPITAAIFTHLDIVTDITGPNLAFIGWILWVAFVSGIILRYPDGPPWD